MWFLVKKVNLVKRKPRVGHLNGKKGYQARPKIHVKRVFFHNRALHVRNVNRVSNSCKIGQNGMIFLKMSYVFRVVFHAKFV